jgi:GNAT superfamily N-acetyltransferase
MLGDLVRRWQAGRSVSRGWTDSFEDRGVIVLRVGDPERMVSYLVGDAELEYAAGLARDDEHAGGLSWLSVVTNEPDDVVPRILAAGLEFRRTEWLMSVTLDRQPVLRAPAQYEVELVRREELIAVKVHAGQELTAGGQMVVVGNDAVADMIWTEPEHRRRGLAGAVMSALVTEAQRAGATTGLLAASPEGRELYAELGWEIFAEILVASTKS